MVFQQLEMHPAVKNILAGTLLCIAVMNMGFAMRDIAFTRRICQERFAVMRAAQQQNQSLEWEFRPVCGMSKFNVLYKTDIMRENAGHFLNSHYARQYKQKSITLTPVPAIQGMEQSILPEIKP